MPVLYVITAVIAFIAAGAFGAQNRGRLAITCFLVGVVSLLAIFVPINVIAIWIGFLLLMGITIGALEADSLFIPLVLFGAAIYVFVKACQMTALLF